jgi:hypothetical protein
MTHNADWKALAKIANDLTENSAKFKVGDHVRATSYTDSLQRIHPEICGLVVTSVRYMPAINGVESYWRLNCTGVESNGEISQVEAAESCFKPDYICGNCGESITCGNHDRIWRHVITTDSEDNYLGHKFPVQCPDRKTLASPLGTCDRLKHDHPFDSESCINFVAK